MNLVKNRKIYFMISALVAIPGLISLVIFGLKPSIDFTGGSRLQVSSQKGLDKQKVEEIIESKKVEVENITVNENGSFLIRTVPVEQNKKTELVESIKKVYPDVIEESFETVGPSIGTETEVNAFKAVLIASIAITLYIAFAFRKVSRPVASWKYGVSAIVALLHDVFIVVGVFSILGVLFKVEIDSLFITALLTVMGFSVHDTIVVFDRIRESLGRNSSASFDEVVNNSLLETINRSLNTSITVVIVLLSLVLFGGESIRWFVVALLIGIVSGTYSSIFIAAQLLVVWRNFDERRKAKAKFKPKKK